MDTKQEFHQIEMVEWEDIPGRKKQPVQKSRSVKWDQGQKSRLPFQVP